MYTLYTYKINTHVKTHCGGGCSSVVANVLDSDIVVSEFELHSLCNIHFRTYILGKDVNSLIHHPQPWIKSYHCSTSTRIAMALNNI